jgi:hypothetical protein
MRKVLGLVLGAVLLPLSVAHAAEVTQLYTNNQFANATNTDEAGNTIGVFVTRVKGKGAPVDSIFVITSDAVGNFAFLSGTLPKNAFHASAHHASVEVDVADIAVTSSFGSIAGPISVDWAAGDVTRESGGTKFSFGNTVVNIVGTSTDAPATITGSVGGVPLDRAVGDLQLAHDSVQIHVSTN